jgi:symplekin
MPKHWWVGQVVKRAILASNTMYRCGFWLLASEAAEGAQAEPLQLLWQTMSRLKDRICHLASHHDNDGVRLNAIKYMEQVVLLYTGTSVTSPSAPAMSVPLSPSHPILKPTVVGFVLSVLLWRALLGGSGSVPGALADARGGVQLARDAQGVLTLLMGLLKAQDADRLSSSATLVAVKALTAIGLQRNQHMGRILPTLLGLASAGENGESVPHASLKAELKKGLLAVLGSHAPVAQAWTAKVAHVAVPWGCSPHTLC